MNATEVDAVKAATIEASALAVSATPAGSGGWITLVAGPRVLALGPAASALVDDCWASLEGNVGLPGVIDALSRAGSGAVPPFALVEHVDGALRVIVRGGVRITVTDDSGAQAIDAGGVATWVERIVCGASGAEMEFDGAVPLEVTLPLRHGGAVAASVAVVVDGAGASVGSIASGILGRGAAGRADTSSGGVEAATIVGLPESPSDGDVVAETVLRPASSSPIAAAETATEADPPPAVVGDHDGQTVLTAEVAELLRSRIVNGDLDEERPAPPAAAPSVVVVSPSGDRESLASPLIVGRAPSVSQVSGNRMPRLVTVGSVDQDISRNHVRIALEGGTVVVTDLHSRNGTSIVLPGKSPQKLRAGEATAVIVGSVIDLGGGITFTVGEE